MSFQCAIHPLQVAGASQDQQIYINLSFAHIFPSAVFLQSIYLNQNHWTNDGGESARSSCAKWHHRPGASANQELSARQVTKTFVPLVMDCAENISDWTFSPQCKDPASRRAVICFGECDRLQ